MPAELYVHNGCRYSAMAMSMLGKAPSAIRDNIKITKVNFKNRPPHVTSVPTLITQNGQMLVGSAVFDYLKRGRKDPKFPLTDVDAEYFSFGKHRKFRAAVMIAIVCVILWWLNSRGYLDGIKGTLGLL